MQPAGQRLTLHQLYTMKIHDPEIAAAELRLLCATCRQIELFELGRARHHDPTVSPSMSSPDAHPSVSEAQPSSSTTTLGTGAAARGDWTGEDVAGVAFG